MFDDFSFGQGLSDAWSNAVSFLLKVVAFLVILLVGRIVVGIVRKVAYKALTRFGFDNIVQRAGLGKALTTRTMGPSALVAKLGYCALMLMVLTFAFAAFGANNPISEVLSSFVTFLPRVFVAIAIVVIAGFVATVVRGMLTEVLDDVAHGALLARIASIGIMVIGGFAALNQLQIAPAIVNGLFYAMLAVIVGSAIVSIGGGGIAPMRRQWDRQLNRMGQGEVDLTDTAQRNAQEAAATQYQNATQRQNV